MNHKMVSALFIWIQSFWTKLLYWTTFFIFLDSY